MSRQFLVVSTGRNTSPWVERCLRSVADQQYRQFRMVIVDDASDDDSAEKIERLCDELGERFTPILNDIQMGAMFNQVQAIRKMAPDPDDVIVWVDTDDRLLHENVLARLRSYYNSPGDAGDSVLMTYGQYRSEPFSPTCNLAFAYPPEVIANSSYRSFTHKGGGIRFNHLRTVMAKLFYAMDDSDFQDQYGNWFQSCCDAAIMIPALELADGRFRFVDEILYVYNSENPNSDWRRQPRQVDADHHRILYQIPKKQPYGR